MYYRNAQAAVVVYDITKATSLEKAKSWVKELQRQANPNIVIALAGNKLDLVQPSSSSSASATSESEDEPDDATATPGEAPASSDETESLRQVPREEAQAYATEAGLLFFETSAKTGEGIVDIFTEIGRSLCYLAVHLHHLIAAPVSSQEDSYRVDYGLSARNWSWSRSLRRGSVKTRRRCEPRRKHHQGQGCLQLLSYQRDSPVSMYLLHATGYLMVLFFTFLYTVQVMPFLYEHQSTYGGGLVTDS